MYLQHDYLAEAEASEDFATAAEAAAGAAEAAAAAEGGGVLAALGEGALAAAGTVGSRGCPGRHGVGDRGRAQRGFAPHGLGCRNGRRHGLRRLAAEHDHGRADPEWHARKRRRGPLLDPGAAEGPAAGGLQDRHGVGERAQEPAAAADPKPPGEASEAPGANALRAEQRSHPGVLRQRTLPGQPPVPRRPPRAQPEASRASGNPAVLRGASTGERTGSCIGIVKDGAGDASRQ